MIFNYGTLILMFATNFFQDTTGAFLYLNPTTTGDVCPKSTTGDVCPSVCESPNAACPLHIFSLDLVSPFHSPAGGPAVITEGGPSCSKTEYVHSHVSVQS